MVPSTPIGRHPRGPGAIDPELLRLLALCQRLAELARSAKAAVRGEDLLALLVGILEEVEPPALGLGAGRPIAVLTPEPHDTLIVGAARSIAPLRSVRRSQLSGGD